jgi:hypothetical protein
MHQLHPGARVSVRSDEDGAWYDGAVTELSTGTGELCHYRALIRKCLT